MKTKLKLKTKILSILLCAVMVLGELPFVALAAASGTGWSLDDDKLLTIESNAGITDWLANGSTNASKVEAVYIQDSVTTIDTGAFGGCNSITSITFNSIAPPTFGDNVFGAIYVSKGLYVIVPDGAVESYTTALSGKLPSNAQIRTKVDITNDFTDPNFLATVRKMLGKEASDPIYDTDVDREYVLMVDSKSIASLAGIEHFTALTELTCIGTNLESLPKLPSTLTKLDCSYNNLTELPEELPENLTSLECDNNALKSLPKLPDNLTSLNCSSNELELLPKLPSSLTKLECNWNNLKSLPELPDTLEDIVCYWNKLTSLPELPDELKKLQCNYNDLTSLPELPDNLTHLDCFGNDIKSLPELPSTLTNLACNGNELTSLPKLPGKLEELDCSDNDLTSLPELPDNLKKLACSSNAPMSLPEELPKNLTHLDCSSNELKSLPKLPSTLTHLECAVNNLKSLPELPDDLKELDCDRNELTSLPKLPSTLTKLECNHNGLMSLAVSELPNLKHLECYSNLLTELTLNNSAPYNHIDVSYNYMKDTSTSITGKTITWDTGEFTFTPQKTGADTHTHAFTGEWKSDVTGHWQECTCGEKDIVAAHTPGDWITDTPVTEIVDGTKHKECTVCGFITETGTIPATGAGSDDNGTSDSGKTGDSDSDNPNPSSPQTGDSATGNPNPSSPQTGDNSNVLLWAILALLSMSGIALTILTKSRRYKE